MRVSSGASDLLGVERVGATDLDRRRLLPKQGRSIQ
jgi:hypothetical protein